MYFRETEWLKRIRKNDLDKDRANTSDEEKGMVKPRRSRKYV